MWSASVRREPDCSPAPGTPEEPSGSRRLLLVPAEDFRDEIIVLSRGDLDRDEVADFQPRLYCLGCSRPFLLFLSLAVAFVFGEIPNN